jgi:hypothetical protein
MPPFMRMVLVTLLGTAELAFGVPGAALAGAAKVAQPELARLDESCSARPADSWLEQEKWVWKQICTGRTADLNERDVGHSALSPHDGTDWPQTRVLRPQFVKTILVTEPFRSAIPHQGVHIVGGLIDGPLDLQNIEPRVILRFHSSRFNGPLAISGMVSSHAVDLEKSHINGNLDANSITVRRLELVSLHVTGKVDLTGSKINGYLVAKCSYVSESVWADFIEVSGFALLDHSTYKQKLMLRYAKIGADLNLHRSDLHQVDLSGASIYGQLLIDDNLPHSADCEKRSQTVWSYSGKDKPRLAMRNTSVGSLRGTIRDWPALELDGLTYSRIHIDGLSSNGQLAEWAIKWLEKDESQSLQPYYQLSEAMTKVGLGFHAGDVLFSGRERERGKASGLNYAGMTVARYLVGYGYGYRFFFALGWAVLFVGIGYLSLRYFREDERRADGQRLGLLYCVDMLLPLIQFRKSHYDIELATPSLRRYFLLHRIAGYILGAFILAGISGLTK